VWLRSRIINMVIKVGDEVAILATVLKRVTEDRVSVSIQATISLTQ